MKIRKDILEKIIAHAKKDAPLEACGYLAAQNGVVVTNYELTNTDASEEHFNFDPKEQFQALREARAQGLEICAVYHSHPVTPARPSPEDIKLAHDPALIYVIVSLAGAADDVKAYRIKGSQVEPQNLEIVEDAQL